MPIDFKCHALKVYVVCIAGGDNLSVFIRLFELHTRKLFSIISNCKKFVGRNRSRIPTNGSFLMIAFRANKKSFDEKKVKDLLKQQYKELGSITWEQCWILFLFFATTVLWFTRKPGFFKGWDSYFPKGYVTDGTVSLGAGLLMFLLPKNKPTFFTCKGKNIFLYSQCIFR